MRKAPWQLFPPVMAPVLLLLCLYLYQFALYRFRISPATIGDVDTLMRLAYVREIMAHGWQGGFFARNNAPYGMVLHWTRPFYYLIIALTRCLWFLPTDRALAYAGFFTGPLMGICTAAAAYWAGRGFLQEWYAATASAAIVSSTSAIIYSNAGTANYHAITLALALVLSGFAVRLASPVKLRTYLIAGVFAGLGSWVSFELFVAGQVVMLFLLYLWIVEGRQRLDGLLAFTTAYCAATLAALLDDPPYLGLGAPELYRICLPYLLVIASEVAAILLALRLPLHRPVFRSAWLVIAGAISWAAVTSLYPELKPGGQGRLNPIVRTEWLSTIAETMPVGTMWMLLVYLGNGILGMTLWMLNPPGRVRYCAPVLALMAVLLVAGQLHLRLAIYAWAGGTYMATVSLQAFAKSYGARVMGTRTIEEIRFVLFLPFACLFIVFGLRMAAYASVDRVAVGNNSPFGKMECGLSHVLPALNDRAWLKGGDAPIFATDFDLAEGLLFWTDYRTLAGNYHADAQGINDEFLLFRDMGDATARSVVGERGIRFIMLCPQGDENRFGTLGVQLFRKYSTPGHEFSQGTLYTRLVQGNPPDWLVRREWPAGTRTGLLLYQVREPS